MVLLADCLKSNSTSKMRPSAVTMLGCVAWIFMCLGTIAPVSSKGIRVKQYPSDLCVGLGHSAAIICAFELDKERTRFDVYWLKRDNQNKTRTVVHVASRNFLERAAKGACNDSETGIRVSGNLNEGFLILELKTIQEADFGLYICKVTGTIPPPHEEGRANGTLIRPSCASGCTRTSGPGNATQHTQNHRGIDSTFIALVVFLATYALIITTVALLGQFRKKGSKEARGDSLIYEDMNGVKRETLKMRTH